MEKGNLLFQLATAEDKGQNKTLNAWIMVAFVILCIVVSCFGMKYMSDSMYNQFDNDENTLFYILIFGIFFGISFVIVWVLNEKRKGESSQLYIYEQCVEGNAIMKPYGFNTTFEKFSLSYNDIINISTNEKYVIIYAQNQTYNVLAFNKQNQIIHIINEQKTKLNIEQP
ncbi:MAG: DUF2627 family protein [Clostridia bacterium]|nr:DUF2627 family protein [Clostridia bacterium]